MMKTRKINYSHTCIFSLLLLVSAMLIPACTRHQIEPRPTAPPPIAENAININTATKEQLAKLLSIGDTSAAKIAAHREKYGPFRRPEHIMLVDGISDKKFRLIWTLIKAE